jgi:hypothetical protein
MAPSFRQLSRDLRRISGELLPPVNPLVRYSDGEVLRMFSFRLLAHAEVEGFLESLAEEMVVSLSVKNDMNTLRPIVRERILHHYLLTKGYPPRTLVDLPLGSESQKAIRGVLNNTQNDVEKNNGASEKDVLKLFLPLGVPIAFFDRDWLRSMNDLARARGEVAHNPWSTSVAAQQPSPQDERRRLVRPLWGLKRLAETAKAGV